MVRQHAVAFVSAVWAPVWTADPGHRGALEYLSLMTASPCSTLASHRVCHTHAALGTFLPLQWAIVPVDVIQQRLCHDFALACKKQHVYNVWTSRLVRLCARIFVFGIVAQKKKLDRDTTQRRGRERQCTKQLDRGTHRKPTFQVQVDIGIFVRKIKERIKMSAVLEQGGYCLCTIQKRLVCPSHY